MTHIARFWFARISTSSQFTSFGRGVEAELCAQFNTPLVELGFIWPSGDRMRIRRFNSVRRALAYLDKLKCHGHLCQEEYNMAYATVSALPVIPTMDTFAIETCLGVLNSNAKSHYRSIRVHSRGLDF